MISIPDRQNRVGLVIHIAGYDYAVPAWWDSVLVTAADSLNTQEEVRQFVTAHCGSDDGSAENWREALKIWAGWYRRHGHIPLYLAHCHLAGGEHARAAEIYCDLYLLADSIAPEKRDWHRCFLAYKAGECNLQLEEIDKARQWYTRAAEYSKHEDSGVSYYGETASQRLASLKDR